MHHAMEVIADAASPVVVKRATGVGADALRREGERLQAAAHPGVVELLGSSRTDDGWALCMVYGGRPLEVVGSLAVGQVAAVVAAVAATLADLHDLGVVHGRIDGSHVLLGPHGRPALCGLGPGPDGLAPTPADDVAALGALLAALVGPTVELEPIPERRWWPRRSSSEWERRSLLLLADQACADPPTRRPTARRLAAAVADAVPGAGGANAPPPSADPIEVLRATAVTDAAPRRPARLPSLAVALVGVALMGAGALRVTSGGATTDRLPMASAPAVATTTTTTTSVVDTALPPTTTTTVAAAPCVLLPGTAAPGPCAGDVRVDGNLVAVGGRTYEVGQVGDVVVLGDWDCDGGATPAVLRPSTGEVFVFTSWSTSADLVVDPLHRVPRGAALVAEPRPGGCSALRVQRADGSTVPIATDPTA